MRDALYNAAKDKGGNPESVNPLIQDGQKKKKRRN